MSAPTTDLTNLFSSIALALIVIVPAITMSSVSKERQNGNIEYILTQPITEFEYVLGKVLSLSIFVTVLILLTLPKVFILSSFGSLDSGQLFTQYLGSILIAVAFVSVGVCLSSLFKSEIISFVSTIVTISILMLIGSPILTVVPLRLQQVFYWLSPLARYQSVSRGIFDISDIAYFLSFSLLFVVVTRLVVASWRYPSSSKSFTKIAGISIVFLAVFISTAYLTPFLNLRLDLTSQKLYTLSLQTSLVLSKLQKPISITFFVSNNVPLELQPLVVRASNLLRDYKANNPGKVNLSFVDFDLSDQSKQTEASQYNVFPQNSIVTNFGSIETKAIIVGIGFEYDGTKNGFNLSQDVSNLEFRITRSIMQIAKIERPVVGIVENKVLANYKSGFTQIPFVLSDFFEFTDLVIDENTDLSKFSSLIIVGPSEDFGDGMKNKLREYVRSGGSVLIFFDPVIYSDQTGLSLNQGANLDLFKDFGIELNTDFVLDYLSSQYIYRDFFIQPLPEFPIIIPTDFAKQNLKIGSKVTLRLPSSFKLDLGNEKIKPIYVTSTKAKSITEISKYNNQTYKEDINNQAYTEDKNYETRYIGVSYENDNAGKIVAFSDAEFISDEFVRLLGGADSPFVLGLSSVLSACIEWLSKASINISEIIGKTKAPDFILIDQGSRFWVVNGSGFIMAGIIASVGVLAYFLRSRKKKEKYSEE